MIKFFRKIRQKLLNENRFSKYLIYALGEIILVVIGIVIALQINNWNEEQKTKKLEQQLLVSLLEEFEANLDLLHQTMAMCDSITSKTIELGEFTGPSLPIVDELVLSKILIGVFKYESKFIPNQGVLNEIMNSGRLSVISDAELRKEISTWQSELVSVQNQEAYVLQRRDIAFELYLRSTNLRRLIEVVEDTMVNVTPSRFPDNDFKILESQEFESQLYLYLGTSKNLKFIFYEPLKARLEDIIARIKNNIL